MSIQAWGTHWQRNQSITYGKLDLLNRNSLYYKPKEKKKEVLHRGLKWRRVKTHIFYTCSSKLTDWYEAWHVFFILLTSDGLVWIACILVSILTFDNNYNKETSDCSFQNLIINYISTKLLIIHRSNILMPCRKSVRIMWPNIIYMMPLLLTNKYSVSCEIMQYFYDVSVRF